MLLPPGIPLSLPRPLFCLIYRSSPTSQPRCRWAESPNYLLLVTYNRSDVYLAGEPLFFREHTPPHAAGQAGEQVQIQAAEPRSR